MVGQRLSTLVCAANFESVRFRGHGFVETSEAEYMLTVIDRRVNILSATGIIGVEAAAPRREGAGA
jgi:hypothetical protein